MINTTEANANNDYHRQVQLQCKITHIIVTISAINEQQEAMVERVLTDPVLGRERLANSTFR